MKLPRDLSGAAVARSLTRLGYVDTRQSGSHLRLTHPGPPQHHITIPLHDALRPGTLSAILVDVATHLRTTKEELIRQLF